MDVGSNEAESVMKQTVVRRTSALDVTCRYSSLLVATRRRSSQAIVTYSCAGEERVTMDPWPSTTKGGAPTILITSGASCPDASVERVLRKVLEGFPGGRDVDAVLTEFENTQG